jgi:hypothetical protein
VVSPGIRAFHGAYGRREMPPRWVSAQLRARRHSREADGENSPPPRLGPRDRETPSGPLRASA